MINISSAQSLLSHRQQFPALANKAYFNYGGQGPLPQAALEAIHQTYDYIQSIGPFGLEVNNWVTQEVKKTREAIASELGVSPDTITITENVTVGCNIPLWGIDWQAGDHVLLSDCEHPGVIATLQEIQRRFGIEVSTFELMDTLNQGDPVAAVTKHLRSNTRLVVLSHILWNTGQVLPLAKIASAVRNYYNNSKPAKILVDAAQSVGVLPLNLSQLGIDFYAFTGHKWWCGSEGVGGLYVKPDSENQASLNPTFIGWRSIIMNESGFPVGWQQDGRRFEVATSAVPLYAGLRSAIATHQQWGTNQERYQQILELSKYLWQKLSQLPEVNCLKKSPPEAGLVSFQIQDKSHAKLVQFLESQKIFIRQIRDPDCVRASVHYLTLPSEIDQVVAAIHQYCAQKISN
ncbi:MAG: aminotransferase class V-fold PLP-dependent enzyme [Crinalium sp.]